MEMEEIILIQPKAGMYEIVSIRLPLSCLAVATLPDSAGYKVKIIDQRTDKNWYSTLINSLKSEPICVGVTCMTGPQIQYALEASRCVKENSDTPVVWGGVHPTLLPKQTLENKNIDIIVSGEGEVTFFELIRALEKEKPLEGVKGIWYKQEGEIKRTSPRPFIDLNDLPNPPYHLVDIHNYSAFDLSGKGEQALSVMTSRGCPYRCAFCYNTVFNKRKWRALSVENALKRIKYVIDSFGAKSIYFPEDNFSFDLKRFEGIIKGIIKEDLDISWGSQGIRIDSVGKMSNNLLKLAEKSGCKNLDIGIESGSPRILKLIKKDITVQQFIDGHKKLSKFPFIIKYNFMVGIPTETKQELNLSVNLASKLIKENRKAYMLFHIYTPFPGTELFQISLESGFKPPITLEEWSKFNYIDWVYNYPSWLLDKNIKILGNLSFISRLANRNIRYKITNKYIKIIFDLYCPIAKFRFNHNFYYFFIEKAVERNLRPILLKHISLIGKKYTNELSDISVRDG